jgi:hypothetical protein
MQLGILKIRLKENGWKNVIINSEQEFCFEKASNCKLNVFTVSDRSYGVKSIILTIGKNAGVKITTKNYGEAISEINKKMSLINFEKYYDNY